MTRNAARRVCRRGGGGLWSAGMRTLTFNRVVGSGAMGTVYHAELRAPQGFARACAVKVMKALEGDHAHFVARMRDEARLLGMLQDESILGVSELVHVEGRDAVVMEFVEGVDLQELRTGPPIPPRALVELGAELAGTLHRAHTATHPRTGAPLKVIHRDVKPANVMITSRGGVRLLDFGVARAAFGGRESQTRGLVLGTLNYFSPEILIGHEPSPAVDLWGLALTLWETATREAWGPPVVKANQLAARVERRLGELRPEYAPLAPVLARLLSFEPEGRPSGAEVEQQLLALADRMEGAGLRTWARDAVPRALSERPAAPAGDPLVGRTIEVTEPPEDAEEEADPRWAEPLARPEAAAAPAARRRARGGGLPLWAMALLGVGLGGAVGVAVVAAIGGVIWAMG